MLLRRRRVVVVVVFLLSALFKALSTCEQSVHHQFG
jgi:hypothetical protein